MRVFLRDLAFLLVCAVLLAWWDRVDTLYLVLRAPRGVSVPGSHDTYWRNDAVGPVLDAPERSWEDNDIRDEDVVLGRVAEGQDEDQEARPENALEDPCGSGCKYLGELRKIESDIAYWSHTKERNVFIWGARSHLREYMNIYASAFGSLGFEVRRRAVGAGQPATMSVMNLANEPSIAFVCVSFADSSCFETTQSHHGIKRHQRVNRLILLREVLWDKASFCKTLSNGTRGDPRLARFTFPCWVLPEEMRPLLDFARSAPQDTFISKPTTEGAGRGIRVVENMAGLRSLGAYRTPHIVQTYLRKPHLIKGHKWDMRTFVLVSSVVPMRAYIYERGIVRFASSRYSPRAKNGGKKTQFLTNTHISMKYGRKSANVTSVTWSLSDLRRYMDASGESFEELLRKMRGAVSTVLLSGEYMWRDLFRRERQQCLNCYQVLGVDIIVDEDGDAFVIEVNGQPSMLITRDEQDHYSTTKALMLRDTANLIYNTDTAPELLATYLRDVDPGLLQQLTQREWSYLIEYVNERRNLGGFLPVYPASALQDVHDAFFDVQREQRDPEERIALHRILAHIEAAFPVTTPFDEAT